MLVRALSSAGGGGINTLITALNNGTTVTSDSSGVVSVTNGKTYLVLYSRGSNATHGLVSGGTELYTYILTDNGGRKTYLGIIKATSSTLIFNGTSNPTYIAQLD